MANTGSNSTDYCVTEGLPVAACLGKWITIRISNRKQQGKKQADVAYLTTLTIIMRINSRRALLVATIDRVTSSE
jgi:hypothetical protein